MLKENSTGATDLVFGEQSKRKKVDGPTKMRGKSSDPAYSRTTAYIKNTLLERCKQLQRDNDDMEYSTVIALALEKFLKEHGY